MQLIITKEPNGSLGAAVWQDGPIGNPQNHIKSFFGPKSEAKAKEFIRRQNLGGTVPVVRF